MSIIPIIQQAILAGFGEDKILNFIAKRLPELSKGIQNAKDSGFDPSKILRFISYNAPSKNKKKLAEQESANDRYLSGVGLKTREQREEQRMKLLKGALGVGAGILGATQLMGPKAIQAAGAMLPDAGSSIGPKPMSNAPVQPEPLSPEATARAASAETLNAVTPEFQQWANQQIAQGNEKPLAVALREFQEQKEQEQTQQNIAKATLDLQQQKQLQRQPLQPEAAQPLEMKKGSVVATPSGQSGLLKDFRQREALIDEDGKIHKVKKEDLIEVPENIAKKDYQSIAKQYFDTFPKEGEGSLSDALSVMAYDPDTRQLIAAFPDSPQNVYVYDNVEPELYEEISSASTAPKTKGGTGVPGVWDVNVADSRGSPFKKISSNKEKYPFRKLNVGYNMFGKLADAIKEMRKQARIKK